MACIAPVLPSYASAGAHYNESRFAFNATNARNLHTLTARAGIQGPLLSYNIYGLTYNQPGYDYNTYKAASRAVVQVRARIIGQKNYLLGIRVRVSAPAVYNRIGTIYNQPGFTYNFYPINPQSAKQALAVKAHIGHKRRISLFMRGRLKGPQKQFVQIKARVIPSYLRSKSLTAKARLTHHSAISARAFMLAHPTRTLQIIGSVLNTVQHSMTIKSRMFHGSVLYVKAKITQTHGKSLKMCGHILGPPPTHQAFTAKAKLGLRQGWPIPAPSGGNFTRFTDTRLRVRGSIKGANKAKQKLTIKSRIHWLRGPFFDARAFIVRGGTLGMSAFIQPNRYQKIVTAAYSVEATQQNRVRAVFYTKGNYVFSSMSVGAFIETGIKKRITAHFIVTRPNKAGTVQSIKTVIFGSGTHITLSAKARITK